MTTNTPERASPKISIVTPSFNQGQFLEHTILSVLNQNYPNLEYIVIDGGSTDRSVEIIKKYEKHLTFWCSEPDGGHYSAVMKGFDRATGDIFAWINSDDMYVPGAFDAVASIFIEFPNVRWLSTLQQLLWNAHGECAGQLRIPGFSKAALLDGLFSKIKGFQFGFIQQESTFWRSSLWHEVGGLSTSLELAADFDLWCRFYRREQLYGVATPLAGFRLHDSNRSADIGHYIAEAEQSLRELRDEMAWTGQDFTLKGLDLISKIPKARGALRLARSRFGTRYSALNIYSADNEMPGRWELRVVTF